MRKHVIGVVALALGSGVVAAHPVTAEPTPAGPIAAEPLADSPVLDWNRHTAAALRAVTPAIDPLHESRIYAMVHIAIHDALNSVERRFEPYTFSTRTEHPSASPDAAAAAAAHGVLVSTLRQLEALDQVEARYDASRAIEGVEARYVDALAAIPDSPAEAHGVVIGAGAAAGILAERVDDGALGVELLDFDYEQGPGPGEYRFPIGSPLAFAPRWYDVRPFVLRDASQFLRRPPFDVRSRRYAADVDEVKRLGGDGTSMPTERNAEQTAVAHFWFESSPAMWNRIAVTLAAQEGLDLWEQARLFALMDMGMADGYVGNWFSKYAAYNRWRPETAIHEPVSDDNPLTIPAPAWRPLIPTGATPSYDSGHSIEAAVATRVMARMIGTDHVSFSACTLTPELPNTNCDDPAPTIRHFTSLSQAAAENDMSRIYAGWHFRDDVEQGARHGRRIADHTLAHFLRPARG